jgi:ubiquinone biosynthesis accessory factor UbiJ
MNAAAPLDALLRPFESVLNRNIGASTPARELLQQLAGRSFAIEAGGAPGPTLRIRFFAEPTGVRVASSDAPADATVAGTPLSLLALLRGDAQGRLQSGGATIRGDAETAKAFEQLLKHARPDLEEELARLVGDGPAYHAARLARGVLQWGRQAADSLARNVGEYLQEEGRDVPARAELEIFLEGVDRIREDVDRADARLRILETRLRAP